MVMVRETAGYAGGRGFGWLLRLSAELVEETQREIPDSTLNDRNSPVTNHGQYSGY
jgi:hypothetical protein